MVTVLCSKLPLAFFMLHVPYYVRISQLAVCCFKKSILYRIDIDSDVVTRLQITPGT